MWLALALLCVCFSTSEMMQNHHNKNRAAGELNLGDQVPLFSLPSGLGLENELQIALLKCLTARISSVELQGLGKENSGCRQSDILIVVGSVYSRQHIPSIPPPLSCYPPTSSPASAVHHVAPGLAVALQQVSRLPLVHSPARVI